MHPIFSKDPVFLRALDAFDAACTDAAQRFQQAGTVLHRVDAQEGCTYDDPACAHQPFSLRLLHRDGDSAHMQLGIQKTRANTVSAITQAAQGLMVVLRSVAPVLSGPASHIQICRRFTTADAATWPHGLDLRLNHTWTARKTINTHMPVQMLRAFRALARLAPATHVFQVFSPEGQLSAGPHAPHTWSPVAAANAREATDLFKAIRPHCVVDEVRLHPAWHGHPKDSSP